MSRYYHLRGEPGPSAQQRAQALDQFAEYLSADMALNDIADTMHITRGSACVFLRELDLRYGGEGR
jgi:hypothetical protein